MSETKLTNAEIGAGLRMRLGPMLHPFTGVSDGDLGCMARNAVTRGRTLEPAPAPLARTIEEVVLEAAFKAVHPYAIINQSERDWWTPIAAAAIAAVRKSDRERAEVIGRHFWIIANEHVPMASRTTEQIGYCILDAIEAAAKEGRR